MIEEKLEIIIPTYNRAEYLDNTLSQILNSPFSKCKITIRDNASQDNTPNICAKYQKLFKNITIIRNQVNIGGNANILRCYEESTLKYTWVMGDNDNLDFKDCEDLIKAIDSEHYDLIFCCSIKFPNKDGNSLNDIIKKHNNKPNYLENNARDLAKILKKYYFISMSFISTCIYKRELLDSQCFITANDYISKSYPHYAFIQKSLEDNFLIYKTKKDIIHVNESNPNSEIESFNWVTRWIESSLLIQDKLLQNYASQFYEGSAIFVSIGILILAKAKNEKNLKYEVMDLLSIFFKLKGWFKGFFYNLLLLLTYIIPTFICKLIYKKHTEKNIS